MIEEIKKQSQTREYQRSGLKATSHLFQLLIRINDKIIKDKRDSSVVCGGKISWISRTTTHLE